MDREGFSKRVEKREEQGSGERRIYIGGGKSITTLEGSQASPARPSGRNSMELKMWMKTNFTFMLPCIVLDFFLNNQRDALIIQIYSVTKLYMFRASSLPIIRRFLLYIRHWYSFMLNFR